jgi:hypothetical protein
MMLFDWPPGQVIEHGPDETCGTPHSALVGVPELDADARRRGPGLGHGVLPGALTGAAHDEQVPRTGQVRDREPATGGSQPEGAYRTERDQRDHGLRQLTRDAVAVPGDAVGTVPVEVDADLR